MQPKKKAEVTMTTQKIQKRLDFLTDQTHWLKKKIKEFPEGKLYCERDGHYIKWFIRSGKDNTKKYLPKKQRQLAEQLMQKRYYQAQLTDFQHEIDYLSYSLETIPTLDFETSRLLAENSNYNKLLIETLFNNTKDWSTDFQPCTKNPENLIHNTYSGIKVRSKSEAFIVNALFSCHIPFRYECALQIGNLLLYPDFTIQHPQTGKIYYWEHFGMMDDFEYVDKVAKKIASYCEHGIYPDDSLILTYESRRSPLDSDWVRQIIEHFFFGAISIFTFYCS